MKGMGMTSTLLCAVLMGACIDAVEVQDVSKRSAEIEAATSDFTIPLGIKFVMGGGSFGRRGGATYIRWGRTTCPDVEGTKLLYVGRAAGTDYHLKGGTSDRFCLPEQPEYLTYQGGVQDYSSLHGTEYETNGGVFTKLHDHNVPCAVCHSSSRGSMITIPARLSCPNAWTLEYNGYLMSAHKGHYRTATVCMDKNAEAIAGSAKSTNGALFYQMEANCNGLQCPPYVAEKELTCAVCTL